MVWDEGGEASGEVDVLRAQFCANDVMDRRVLLYVWLILNLKQNIDWVRFL